MLWGGIILNLALLILLGVLLVWFFGCIITYRVGKYTLVEGTGIKSVEFIMLVLYSIGILFYIIYKPAGQWVLLGVLIFWFVVQFFCHWYFTIFGVTENKLKGYNRCFQNTVHIFAQSDTRLIPDLYHIILHMIILTNIILLILSISRGGYTS